MVAPQFHSRVTTTTTATSTTRSKMGNAPSSSGRWTPPPEPQPPRTRSRVHSPPSRDALALRGQSRTSMAQPVTASSVPHHAPLPANPAPKPVPAQLDFLPELDVGGALAGDAEEPTEDLSIIPSDWAAARAAMERAISLLRDHAPRGTRERFQERGQYTVDEEIPVLHKRRITTSESPAEGSPEKVVVKLKTHESPEVDSISRKEPGNVKEPDVVLEEPVVVPGPSQVSSEEPREALAIDDTLPPQVVTILQGAPLVSEGRPIDQAPAPLIPSDRLSSLEEASDTQSEHISSSLEFPGSHAPHPIFDPRVTSPVPFPVAIDHEDQGYGTQGDEDRSTQVFQRAPGKHVHWGCVEAQPACWRLHDEEDQALEEHSPPFSRLLLPAPSVTEPQLDAHPERAASPAPSQLELGRQLLEMCAAQTERDRHIARLRDQLVKKSGLLEQAEADAAEAKMRAALEKHELQAKLDEALEQVQSALQKASCAAEANEQSQRELTEMRAELEAKKFGSAASRLRLADSENGCTKSKIEAGTYRNETNEPITGLVYTDEDRVVHRLMERMQTMEAEMALLRWNEKSFEMMECRNEG